MKNTIKLFGVLLFIFGMFAIVGSVSAADIDKLQPAASTDPAEITYPRYEGAWLDSLIVGNQDTGGVIFFQGSMINTTTRTIQGLGPGEAIVEDNPLTASDNFRIDGRVWRGENRGPKLDDGMPFIVDDDFEIKGDTKTGGGLMIDGPLSRGDRDEPLLVTDNMDLRGGMSIDGPISRGEPNDNGPVIFQDSIRVEGNVVPKGLNDLGSEDLRWSNIYAAGSVTGRVVEYSPLNAPPYDCNFEVMGHTYFNRIDQHMHYCNGQAWVQY